MKSKIKVAKVNLTPVAEVAAPVVEAKPAKKEKATKKETGEKVDRTVRILQAMVKLGKPVSRTVLKKVTGIASGWSSILGAVSKEDGGRAGDKGLVARKLVKVEKMEEEGYVYSVTAAGKKLAETK
jgi:hypothetical protein